MVSNGSRPPALATAELSDPEFEEISGNIFRESKTVRPRPGRKSLTVCLEAISAFREIAAVSPISAASPDDCARFQRAALLLPKNWRLHYPNGKKIAVPKLSAKRC